jgi:hypothetical protein
MTVPGWHELSSLAKVKGLDLQALRRALRRVDAARIAAGRKPALRQPGGPGGRLYVVEAAAREEALDGLFDAPAGTELAQILDAINETRELARDLAESVAGIRVALP